MEHNKPTTPYTLAIAAIHNAGLHCFVDYSESGRGIKLRALHGATIPDCDAPTQLWQTLRLLARNARTLPYTYMDRAGNTIRDNTRTATRFYFSA
jgi:hypothetical protein